MNQIIYILLLFCLLFLIETKAINILLSFVAIMLSLAFILPTITSNVGTIESEYYSYILILVQVSALTILFGFIIMLFPNLSHSTPKTLPKRTIDPEPTKSMKPSFKLKSITIFISLLLLSFLFFRYSKGFFGLGYDFKLSFLHHSFQTLNYQGNLITVKEIINNINSSDTLFLRKIGVLLYSVDHNIIKLLVLTIILLLAIISLFFLI